MATVVSFNNGTFTIPEIGEEDWGGSTKVDGFLIAVANNALSKSGGSFTLTAEVDFGLLFGQKCLYYKSKAANCATSGIVRLANDEGIGWRNGANSANLLLSVNSSDKLEFNGNEIVDSTGFVVVSAGGTGITSYTSGDLIYANGTTSLTKLSLGSANTILVSSGGAPSWALISDSNISASAAISRSKVASGTANHVLINGASGLLDSEAQLSVSRGGTGANSLTGYVKGSGTSAFTASATIPRADLASGSSNHVLINDGSGVVSSEAQLSVSRGGTGANSLTGYVKGNGSSSFTASSTVPRNEIATGSSNHVIINDGSGTISSEAQLSKSRGGCGADVSSVTFPASGTIVTKTATQTLTNKKIRKRIVSLVDAPTISVDASLGDIFRVTVTGNRTLKNPTNLYDGQMLQIHIKQSPVGGHTISFDTMYRFSVDLPRPELNLVPDLMDRFLFEYDGASGKLDLVAVNKGF